MLHVCRRGWGVAVSCRPRKWWEAGVDDAASEVGNKDGSDVVDAVGEVVEDAMGNATKRQGAGADEALATATKDA